MELHKYLVLSPDMSVDRGWLDPPEPGRCVVEVEAPTARQAKSNAIKMHEMRDWLIEARGDDVNPFAGLTVEIMHCEHMECSCWQECKECEEELDRMTEEW